MIKILCGIMSVLALHLYAMPAYVAEVDETDDMVCFCDYGTENLWWWEGTEDFKVWDDVDLVMFDWGTKDVTDDQILNVTKWSYAENYMTKGAK